MSDYEVYCANCRVTFPIGTRTCVHCGERTSKELAVPLTLSAREQLPPNLELPPFEAEELEEEPVRKRGILRMGMGVVWVMLALLGSLYRVCTG